MPLLQFDTTLSLSADEKTAFAECVTTIYTTEMATTAGHVAVTIRNRKPADPHLGRAVDGPLLSLRRNSPRTVVRAQARLRPRDVRIRRETFDVPDENTKVAFTEHPGEAMMGVDRIGGEWDGE